MRSAILCILIPLVLALISCGQRKRDAFFYEQMVDSIRKAEQLKEMKRQAGVYDDPVDAFYDTLQYCSLPIQSARGTFSKLGQFGRVPATVASRLGYPADSRLKALLLPKAYGHRMLLLSEQQDSITSTLYLYTLNHEYKPIDNICLYEEKSEDRSDDFGKVFSDYYITSEFEVTLFYFYISYTTQKMEAEQSRRFVINRDGYFEEEVIEL